MATSDEIRALVRDPTEAGDPVMRVVLERAAAGSRPGARSDPHVVCLAIEGGGMRGSVSAGMCVVLEAAGLVPSFDRIYGCSAGALNGSYAAAGQATLAASVYQESATRPFIDPRRLLRGQPVVDLGLVFDELLAARRPHSVAGLAGGPSFRALAVAPREAEVRVLAGLRERSEVLGAVRASCSVPLVSGEAPAFRGESLLDGGFLESLSYGAALREGATHVLVLRSRSAGYRMPAYTRAARMALSRMSTEVSALARGRPERYNREAEELERLVASPGRGSAVAQVAPRGGHREVPHLCTDRAHIGSGIRLGAATMSARVLHRQPDPLAAAA